MIDYHGPHEVIYHRSVFSLYQMTNYFSIDQPTRIVANGVAIAISNLSIPFSA